MTTPNLMLTEVPEAILTSSDELNESFWAIDAILQLSVISRVTSLPTTATQGDRYIVPSGSRANHIAYMTPSGWRYFVPRRGWIADVADEDLSLKFNGTQWVEWGNGGGGGGDSFVEIRQHKVTWARGGGNPLELPVNDVPVYFDTASTLVGFVIMGSAGGGSCAIDIWKTSLGSYPPDASDSICGGNEPEISGGTHHFDGDLTGWDTAINANDVLLFHLAGTASFEFIQITLLYSVEVEISS